MKLKDEKKFKIGLNLDDIPEDVQFGEYTDLLNSRIASSSSQKGAGRIETLQGEVEVIINPDSLQVYYGQSIGGNFVYEGYDEIQIGDQIWMKRNWDADYPGNKVQNNLEANATIYGRLYTHHQAMASDFCPEGWRVPTQADVDALLTTLGGELIAGGALKEAGTSHWIAPNIAATDSHAFRALPGGKFDDIFSLLGQQGLFWVADDYTPPAGDALVDKDGNGYTTIVIGVQEWIIENLKTTTYADDTAIPHLPVKEDWLGLSATEALYGALYNWYAATYAVGGASIAEDEWSVPSAAQSAILMRYLDPAGTASSNVAGGKLKEVGLTYWNTPNTDATNEVGFNGRGCGRRTFSYGGFASLKNYGEFWTTDVSGADYGKIGSLRESSGVFRTSYGATDIILQKISGLGIRLVKNTTVLVDGETGTYTDYDGNVYDTICIGTQEWMASNLKVKHYNDGTPIPNIVDNTEWINDTAGAMCIYTDDDTIPSDAYCFYDNDEAENKEPYGALYNGLAVASAHGLAYLEIAGVEDPGWRVPTYADIEALVNALGGVLVAGGALKEAGIEHWDTPNVGADNSSGFTALGAGIRYLGDFAEQGALSWLWTSDMASPTDANMIVITADATLVTLFHHVLNGGLSVRLVRDVSDIPLPEPEEYVIFTDGVTEWRKGVRLEKFVLDRAITPTGFAGAENTDWINVKEYSYA